MDDWETLRGIPFSSSAARRLTPDEVREMRRRYFTGESKQIELAREYAVHESSVWNWVHKDMYLEPQQNNTPPILTPTTKRHRDYNMRAMDDNASVAVMVAEIDRALWSDELKRMRGLL